jgi:hypothetical protein
MNKFYLLAANISLREDVAVDGMQFAISKWKASANGRSFLVNSTD